MQLKSDNINAYNQIAIIKNLTFMLKGTTLRGKQNIIFIIRHKRSKHKFSVIYKFVNTAQFRRDNQSETMKKSVAVVTDELSGINRGGGIGTCANGLVRTLTSIGYSVDVIITDLNYKCLELDFHGARIISLRNHLKDKDYNPIDHVTMSYGVYEILCEKGYEVVHFNDWRGSGYYYSMACSQGLISTKIVSHLHGPSKWVRKYNLELADVDAAELDALERAQIENSDFVISPSQYLLDWYKKQGIKITKSQVINWILPEWLDYGMGNQEYPLKTKPVLPNTIKEVIFFGRHERRKGFDLFIQAVAKNSNLKDTNITFLGRFDRIEREFTGSRALRFLEIHGGAIRFINNLDHKAAFEFLKNRKNSLVVIPSVIENSPCVVGECFTLEIPFITTNVGGIPELFDEMSKSSCMSKAEPDMISNLIENVIIEGLPSAVSTLTPKVIINKWIDFHKHVFEYRKSTQDAGAPLVSVCIVHHNRPKLLKRALTALSNQTYKNFEVILVDDGSRAESLRELDLIENEFKSINLKIIKSKNNYLGAARNLAAKNSSGEFLIFHDDDNISEPEQIEIFSTAINKGDYDILTSQYYAFHDQDGPEKAAIMYFPIGVGGAFSFFRNRFGDANAIIRKSVFSKIGGFSELKGVGWEDWEMFLRAYINGFRMGIVPKPLFRYRISSNGMLASTSPASNHARIISAVESEKPFISSDLIEFAKRDSVSQHVLDYSWELLGRCEHAKLHQDLMALDPNGDDARSKLMELAFAFRRHADAIEIGLELKDGYHHVSNILMSVRDRIKLDYSYLTIPIDIKNKTQKAIILRGWIIRSNYKQINADTIEYSDGLYNILSWNSEFREDVNRHINVDDTESRGFKSVAVVNTQISEKLRGPFSLSRGVKSEKGFSVKLKTPTGVGTVRLRFRDSNYFEKISSGCIDEITHGTVCFIDIPKTVDRFYKNRITVKSIPHVKIDILNNLGLSSLEVETDVNGYATSELLSGNILEISSEDISNIFVFVSGATPITKITVYALEKEESHGS